MYSDKELGDFTKEDEEAQYVEIFEHEDLARIEKALDKLDLSVSDYAPPQARENYQVGNKSGGKKASAKTEEEAKPAFIIEGEHDKHEAFSLKEVLEFVRKQAYKGMHVQRYKGLGEMNPQQLWDTTMDPARRTILRVTLEDAVEVDKTFAMLMGDEVEPRRAFIEAYAHEVKNLDI